MGVGPESHQVSSWESLRVLCWYVLLYPVWFKTAHSIAGTKSTQSLSLGISGPHSILAADERCVSKVSFVGSSRLFERQCTGIHMGQAPFFVPSFRFKYLSHLSNHPLVGIFYSVSHSKDLQQETWYTE